MAAITIVKPDFRITGGFELVMQRVEAELLEQGHSVRWELVDATAPRHDPYGLLVPDGLWAKAPEYFRYLAMVEAFRSVDVAGADVVISTQPPSFAATHPRHLALFSHHLRIYYDLSDAFVGSGFVEDADLHAECEAAVRSVDQPAMEAVRWFCAASPEVERRLRRYNGFGPEKVSQYLAGVAFTREVGEHEGRRAHALCVSRHEWPKRTELFVAALGHVPEVEGVLVGSGGRLPWVQTVQARLARHGVDSMTPEAMWMNTGLVADPEPPPKRSNVRTMGHVPDTTLHELFVDAFCVVAPAYLEDYGLTAIEAMAYGKPLVVCSDGGGLADSVTDGVTGFVVDPTPAAVAGAVRRLRDDPELAASMGAAAREAAAAYTWKRAMEQIQHGLDRVLGS